MAAVLAAAAALPTTALAISDADRQTLLDWHNQVRSEVASGGVYAQPTATNMPKLVWDDTLATLAQNHADTCQYGHNQDRQSEYAALGGTWGYVGENIAVTYSSVTPTPAQGIANAQYGWFTEEEAAYTFGTLGGSDACDPSTSSCYHYTQIVWANTRALGCGIAVCPNMSPPFDGVYTVCNFGPGGNYLGQTPYESGPTASNCPTDLPDVEDGLCTLLPPPAPARLPGVGGVSGAVGLLLLLGAGLRLLRRRV